MAEDTPTPPDPTRDTLELNPPTPEGPSVGLIVLRLFAGVCLLMIVGGSWLTPEWDPPQFVWLIVLAFVAVLLGMSGAEVAGILRKKFGG